MNTMAGGVAPPPHPLDQQWYVAVGNEARGPFPGAKLRDMIAVGELTAASRVCEVGGREWVAAMSVPFLAAIFAERSPPPAVPPITVQIDQRFQAYGVTTGAPLAANARFAGFWIRAAAYLIDGILITIIAVLVGAIIGVVLHRTPGAAGALGSLAGVIVGICYTVIPVSGPKQATWGKQMMGLKIVRVDGQKIGAGLAFGRYLAYMVSMITVWIGFLMVGWTDQKKGLHDMICGTRVVYR